MGPREGEHQEETADDHDGQPDEPVDAAPGDGDAHDCDPEAEGPEEVRAEATRRTIPHRLKSFRAPLVP